MATCLSHAYIQCKSVESRDLRNERNGNHLLMEIVVLLKNCTGVGDTFDFCGSVGP